MHPPANCMKAKEQGHLDQAHQLLGHVSVFMYLQDHRLLAAAHRRLLVSKGLLKIEQSYLASLADWILALAGRI